MIKSCQLISRSHSPNLTHKIFRARILVGIFLAGNVLITNNVFGALEASRKTQIVQTAETQQVEINSSEIQANENQPSEARHSSIDNRHLATDQLPLASLPQSGRAWSTEFTENTSDFPCMDNNRFAVFYPTTSFQLDNAYLALMASWLSHNPNDYDKYQQLKSWGFERAVDLIEDKAGTRGYIADHGDYLLVAFRGTETPKDTKLNALFYQSSAPVWLKAPGAYVHHGMKSVYESIRKDFLTKFKGFGGFEKPVIVVGHSLGGALAVLASTDIRMQGADLLSVYTYGQPKLGNEALVNKIRSTIGDRFYRTMIDSDITSRVPPAKETAQDFANIISEQLPDVRQAIFNMVTSINYTTESGLPQLLTSEGYLLPIADKELEFEHSYWKKISRVLSDRSDLKVLVDFISSRFIDHHPRYYLCSMGKNYK